MLLNNNVDAGGKAQESCNCQERISACKEIFQLVYALSVDRRLIICW